MDFTNLRNFETEKFYSFNNFFIYNLWYLNRPNSTVEKVSLVGYLFTSFTFTWQKLTYSNSQLIVLKKKREHTVP